MSIARTWRRLDPKSDAGWLVVRVSFSFERGRWEVRRACDDSLLNSFARADACRFALKRSGFAPFTEDAPAQEVP